MNDSASEVMTQQAPYPNELLDLVERLEYRPHWRFTLKHEDRGQGSVGLTFTVYTLGYDTYHVDEGQTYGVRHLFVVPAASYNRQSWMCWLLDCLIAVETHECCEFFQIEGERPYAPHHGPGWDPYMVIVHGEDVDRRTRYTGEVAPES